MSEQKPLRIVRGDHNYSLDDSFHSGPLSITQTQYFKAGNIIVAVGELNRRNCWDDEAFDAAVKHLQQSWNAAVKAIAKATPKSDQQGHQP